MSFLHYISGFEVLLIKIYKIQPPLSLFLNVLNWLAFPISRHNLALLHFRTPILLMILVQNFMLINNHIELGFENQKKLSYWPLKICIFFQLGHQNSSNTSLLERKTSVSRCYLWTCWYFPVNIRKFIRTLFYRKSSWTLLLHFYFQLVF